MGDDFPDLSQDQFATLYTNGSVNHTISGQTVPLNMNSETVDLTDAQAELLVHCLGLLQTDVYVTAETARRTQEMLRSRFDLDDGESFFEEGIGFDEE